MLKPRKVRDEFGLPRVVGDIGIEIEVEGNNLPNRPGNGWRIDHDGSLRGESNEYVFDGPASLEDTRNRLAKLDKAYKVNDTEVFESVRAGVHVHINVQSLTMLELANFMTLYLILEDLLVRYCGPHREGNLFCLRTQDAEFAQFQWIKAFKSHQWGLLGDENLRYASMNVCALGKYGSLEFRAMRGTRDLNLIGDWAEILLSLREIAKTFKDPVDIVSDYSKRGVGGFIDHVLGRWAYIFKDYEGWDDLTLNSMRRAQLFAFCCEWAKFAMPKTPTSGLRKSKWAQAGQKAGIIPAGPAGFNGMVIDDDGPDHVGMDAVEIRAEFPVPDEDAEEPDWDEDEELDDEEWDDRGD